MQRPLRERQGMMCRGNIQNMKEASVEPQIFIVSTVRGTVLEPGGGALSMTDIEEGLES